MPNGSRQFELVVVSVTELDRLTAEMSALVEDAEAPANARDSMPEDVSAPVESQVRTIGANPVAQVGCDEPEPTPRRNQSIPFSQQAYEV